MRSNRLQLNADKTEIIWCTSSRRQHQIPTASFVIGADVITRVSSVRDLGIYLDSDLSMLTHMSGCFAVLRQIRSIRRSVTRSILQSLVASLVLTRLDFGCSILAGLPARQLNRLQSVVNAADARLVYSARRSEHMSPLLQELHWLRVPERIDFRLAVLVYRCVNGTAPRYLGSEYNGSPTSSHVGVCDLHRHRHCMFHGRCTRPSAIVPSPLPLQKSGTCCRRRSRHCRHWRHSSAHWRRNCSVDHMATPTIGNSSIDTSVTRDTQRPWSFARLGSRWNSLLLMMMMKIGDFAPTGGGWPKISGRRGRPPSNHSSSQKTRLNDPSRSIKIWTDFFRLSQCTGGRQTDIRTDRILIARPRLHSMQRGNN